MPNPEDRVGYDSTIEGLIARAGEVGAAPAANTILGRLKSIADGVGGSGSTTVENAGTFVVQEDGDALTAAEASQAALEAIDSAIIGAGAPVVDSYADIAISAAADTANQELIATPGANKQIWVMGINFTVGTDDGSVSFQDEDDTAITGVMPFAANGGMAVAPSGNFAMPLWKVVTNKALEVDTVTCDIKGSIQYAIVDVS